MEKKEVDIGKSIELLQASLDKVVTISEWAELMDYKKKSVFSRLFKKHFKVYPGKVVTYTRVISLARKLRNCDDTLLQISDLYSMPDDKSVSNFIYNHLGYWPTEIREMPESQFRKLCSEYYTRQNLPGKIPPPHFSEDGTK